MPENRRTSTRYDVTCPAELTVGAETFERTVTNLSLGGAFVEHEQRIGIGTGVEISFKIPNREEPISVGATVRWATEGGSGIQFAGLRAGDVWALNQFFETLSS